jgi:hypothetical protein
MSKPMSIDAVLPAAKPVATPALTISVAAGERELRLDLFRGLALWLIYIDHLPTSVLTWFISATGRQDDSRGRGRWHGRGQPGTMSGRNGFEGGSHVGRTRRAGLRRRPR